MKRCTDLPIVYLTVAGDVASASGVTPDGIIWSIYTEAEAPDTARCRIMVCNETVADISVHNTYEHQTQLIDKVQGVCAALVWSRIRAIRRDWPSFVRE